MTREYIVKNLKTHLFIEAYYRRRGGFLLEEQENFYSLRLLKEEHGVPEGCEQIAEKVSDYIRNKGVYDVGNKVTIPINNYFVGTVIIDFTDVFDVAAYDQKRSKFDGNIMTTVVIFVNYNKFISEGNRQISIIMHELTHAYTDFEARKRGSSLENELIRSGYNENTLKKFEDPTLLEQTISNIFYFFSTFERGAYIAQIKGEISSLHYDFHYIKEVIDAIENTKVYKMYLNATSNCALLSEIEDKNMQNNIAEDINVLSGGRISTYKDFVKWMGIQCTKTYKKFQSIFPKIAFDIISLPTTTIDDGRGENMPKLTSIDQLRK